MGYNFFIILSLLCYFVESQSLNPSAYSICYGESNPEACNANSGTCVDDDVCECSVGYHGCCCDTKIAEAFLYTNGMVRVPYVTPVQSILDDFDFSSSTSDRSGNVCDPSVEYLFDGDDIYPCPEYFIDNYNILGENISPYGISFDIDINEVNKNEMTKYFIVNSSDLSHLDHLEVVATSETTTNDARCVLSGQFREYIDIPVIGIPGDCLFSDPETCNCTDSRYYGKYCTVFDCEGIARNQSKTVCDGSGICISPNLCDDYQCFQESCGDFGSCVGEHICRCSSDYGGRQCNIPICYGYIATERDLVCSGKGSCFALEDRKPVCRCYKGYKGVHCENTESYFTRAEIDSILGTIIASFIAPGGVAATVGAVIVVYAAMFFCTCGCLTIILVLILGYFMVRKNRDTVPLIIDGRTADQPARNKDAERDVFAEEEFDPYRVIRRNKPDGGNNYEMDEKEVEQEQNDSENVNEGKGPVDGYADNYFVSDEKKDEDGSSDDGNNESKESSEEEEEDDSPDEALKKVDSDEKEEESEEEEEEEEEESSSGEEESEEEEDSEEESEEEESSEDN